MVERAFRTAEYNMALGGYLTLSLIYGHIVGLVKQKKFSLRSLSLSDVSPDENHLKEERDKRRAWTDFLFSPMNRAGRSLPS